MEELRQQYLKIEQQLSELGAQRDALLNELITVYVKAVHTTDHEMVDSIGLWLTAEGNYQTCDNLEAIAATTDDEYLQKDLLEHSQAIENKCAAYCIPRNKYQQMKQKQNKQHQKTRK